MLKKPSWLRRDDYGALLLQCDMAPRCVHCGVFENLTVDHINPQAAGGTDDISNLQVLCKSCNSSKRDRPDWYWSRRFYWDGSFDPDALWTAQRVGVHDLILHGLNGKAGEWFSREWSQIARRLYLLAWVVGSGKTMAIPTLAFTLNALLRERHGPGCRRIDRVLVLAKERAIRDQIADDLNVDLVRFGIAPVAPRVDVLDQGWKWENGALDEADVWVACVQQLFDEHEQPRPQLAAILAEFPLIVIDEPHYANDQVMRLVDAAQSSLCFGLSGTPIDAAGDLLERFVLLSLYGYQDAVGNDQSLKWLPRPQIAPGSELARVSGEIFDELGVRQAEVLKLGAAGMIFDTDGIKYAIQAPPIQSVAERVVQYLGECDQLAPTEEFPAEHRPMGTPATLRYPMHGLIVVESVEIGRALVNSLNRWFDGDRSRFRREHGYVASIIHSETRADGRPISPGMQLTDRHPWMLAYKHGNVLQPSSARILVVVGMAREGVNNPLCGVVGIACSTRSVVEIVQRPIGRSLRGVVLRRGAMLDSVPPSRMDTIRIISHVGFGNRATIEAGIGFVLNMRDALDGLPTLEDVIAEHDPAPDAVVDDAGGLTKRTRLEIAGEIGVAKRIGDPIERERLIDEYGGNLDKKRRAVADWIDLIEADPARASEKLHHASNLESETIVVREATRLVVTNADIRQHINAQHPDLVGILARIDEPDMRLVLERLYVEHQRLYRAPDMVRWTDLERIRRDIVVSILESLGPYYGWNDDREIRRLVGSAVKTVLGVPAGESARVGGRFDIPACHHILTRPAQRHRIEGYVRGRLITMGACPELAAAFGIGDPYDTVEDDDAWVG